MTSLSAGYTRSDRARFAAIVTAALLLLVSCWNGADKALAESAVERFHTQFNAGAFHEMYASSAKDFQSATAEGEWTRLMQSVQRKVGLYLSAKQTQWTVNASTEGTTVSLIYASQFSQLPATEKFLYRIEGGHAVLAGYRIE